MMSLFSFIFSDDAKPHNAKPNAAYYTRGPLFRGNSSKMLLSVDRCPCPWMDLIKRVDIATNIPYFAVIFGITLALLVRTLWTSALTTDSEDSLHIISL